jgi:hypothetical protein
MGYLPREIGFVCTSSPVGGPTSRNWLRFEHFALRALADRPNWVCLAHSVPGGLPPNWVRFACFAPQYPHLPSPIYPSLPTFGFVWHNRSPDAGQAAPNWVCFAQFAGWASPPDTFQGQIGFVLHFTLHTSNFELLPIGFVWRICWAARISFPRYPPMNWGLSRRAETGFVAGTTPGNEALSHDRSPPGHRGPRAPSDPRQRDSTAKYAKYAKGTPNRPPLSRGSRISRSLSSPASSDHQLSIIHHQSQGPPRTRDVPLSRGRVAGIATEFRARGTAGKRVTPGAGRNKEFLARGVFSLFNCCTNNANGQLHLIHRFRRLTQINREIRERREQTM